MLLVIELLMLCLLILILTTLFIHEKRLKVVKSPTGKMTGYWDGAERRTSVRVETTLNTKYSINKKPQQKKNASSENISNGGILINLNEKLAPSTQLLLDIDLPNGDKPVMAKGEVAWVKELSQPDEAGRRLFNTGIRFVSMNLQDRERLDKHIKGALG